MKNLSIEGSDDVGGQVPHGSLWDEEPTEDTYV